MDHSESSGESNSSSNSIESNDSGSNNYCSSDLFKPIKQKKLKTNNIELYSQINDSTIKISSYFESAILKFPSLFESDLTTFEECLAHLEKISIPNKCICAGLIETIPGWRCFDCNKYENAYYCSDCYLNSKDWHKGHKVILLPESGMCDCGDTDSMYTCCREHKGPFTTREQIEEYIEQNFGKKVTLNLRAFFDEFFAEFEKYLVLTGKCDLFMQDFFADKFNGDIDEDLQKEKKDVIFLKTNFKIVFQNLIYFFKYITKNNIGMLHILADYFTKNNLANIDIEDIYQTYHRCIEINPKDIKIYYDTPKTEKHKCKCPFFANFLINFRNNITLNSEEEAQEFFVSLAHNLPLRFTFGVLNFFLYKENLYNFNENLINSQIQFYLEDAIELVAKKNNVDRRNS